MKFKIKLIKKPGGCYIKLPEQFCNDMELENTDELVGKITPKGNLELSRPLGESDMCQICHKKPHKNNVCINCSKVACAGCFWELGSLCHECLGKSEQKVQKSTK